MKSFGDIKSLTKKVPSVKEQMEPYTKTIADVPVQDQIKPYTETPADLPVEIQNKNNLAKLSEKLKIIKVSQNMIVLGDFYFTVDTVSNTPIYKSKEGDIALPIHKISNIIITPYGRGTFSDKFFTELAKSNVHMMKLDFYGNPIWGFYPLKRKMAYLITGQTLLNTNKYNIIRANLITWLITNKLQSEATDISKVPKIKAGEDIKSFINRIRLYEGIKAKEYWAQFIKKNNLNEYMESRATAAGSAKKSNRKATDVINILLNLGYGILAHKLIFELYYAGFTPEIGFYHVPLSEAQRYSLVYDLIEPLRIHVDNLVLKNLGQIKYEDFIFDVADNKRYMMLQEAPHVFGRVGNASSYKKWVTIFIDGLSKSNIYENTLNMYKTTIEKVLTTEKYPSKQIKRALRGYTQISDITPEEPIEEPINKEE